MYAMRFPCFRLFPKMAASFVSYCGRSIKGVSLLIRRCAARKYLAIASQVAYPFPLNLSSNGVTIMKGMFMIGTFGDGITLGCDTLGVSSEGI
jgi:hypothetical protein